MSTVAKKALNVKINGKDTTVDEGTVVLEVCKQNDIEVYQKDFSLIDVYSADESFVTGTFGGVKPVASVDGRQIGDGKPGSMTARLGKLYNDLVDRECR